MLSTVLDDDAPDSIEVARTWSSGRQKATFFSLAFARIVRAISILSVFDQGFPDRVALGFEEGVCHRPADQNMGRPCSGGFR